MVSVINEINSRVHILVEHSGIGRHVGMPVRGIFANKVIHPARLRALSDNRRTLNCSYQLELQSGAHRLLGLVRSTDVACLLDWNRLVRAQRKHYPTCRQKGCVSLAAGKEFYLWACLTLVRLKGQRQRGVAPRSPLRLCRVPLRHHLFGWLLRRRHYRSERKNHARKTSGLHLYSSSQTRTLDE